MAPGTVVLHEGLHWRVSETVEGAGGVDVAQLECLEDDRSKARAVAPLRPVKLTKNAQAELVAEREKTRRKPRLRHRARIIERRLGLWRGLLEELTVAREEAQVRLEGGDLKPVKLPGTSALFEPDALLKMADEAVYAAKNAGRNCVVMGTPPGSDRKSA